MNTKLLVSGIATISALMLPSAPVHAAFVLLENFDSLNISGLNGQGGWTANPKTSVVNTGGTNNAASIATGAANNLSNYHALGGLSIADASTAATVYWNFSISSAATGTGPNNWNFILSDVAAPANTAGDSEVQFNWDGSATGVRVNDGGAFKTLTLDGSIGFVPLANTLYNSWFQVNNSTNTYSIFLQSDGDARVATRTQLVLLTGGAGTFTFRNGAANNDLVTFNFGSNGTGSVVQVDDIYVDTAGFNAASPTVPEPTSVSLIALAGLALCNRRRRG